MGTSAKTPTVLVVDDDAGIRLLVASLLKALMPVAVLEASNGGEALALANQAGPDLIVTDLEMEPVNGIEFIEHWRANELGEATPILMVTGHTGTERLSAAMAAGADAILSKPIDAPALYAQVTALLDRRSPLECAAAR